MGFDNLVKFCQNFIKRGTKKLQGGHGARQKEKEIVTIITFIIQ